MKIKDIVTVTSATSEVSLGKILYVKEVLGKDSVTQWYLFTDGNRDYILSGNGVALSVEYNVEV